MNALLSPVIDTIGEITERCDRCGAAAKLEVVLTVGGDLAFCGHHANRHRTDITKAASKIRIENGFDWAGK